MASPLEQRVKDLENERDRLWAECRQLRERIDRSRPTLLFPSLVLVDGVTAPSTLTGYAKIYVDTADGDLKIKFGDGTVKTLSADT